MSYVNDVFFCLPSRAKKTIGSPSDVRRKPVTLKERAHCFLHKAQKGWGTLKVI